MKRLLLLGLLLCSTGAEAQNVTCPTRAPGDNSNACASTSFVQQATGALNAISGLTGDVSATGPGSVTATIQPGVVTGAKIASGTVTGTNIGSNTVANSNLANMNAGTIKGNNTGGAASPIDLTGLQAEGVLQFLQSGTGAVQRGVDSKLKDWVSALDFAVGNCSTDDSTAIQNAINSLADGGTVYFPPAPGGCYAIGTATTITLPTTKAVTLLGAGRGDSTTSAGTVLKATAVLSGGVINSGTVFIRGHRISNMTILGNAQAAYCLKMDQVDASTFDNLNLYDCTTINFRLGDGVHNTQENTIFAVRLDNPLTTVLANLPTYNLEVNGTNNNIAHVKAANAKTANIHSGSTSSNNTYIAVHGYDFFSGQAQAPTNNILVDGSGEQFVSCEGDGSSSVNFQINGFGNIFQGCVSQFASPLTAQVGMNFGNATSGNIAANNQFANSTTANTITQTAPAAPGNFFDINNYNSTQGVTVGRGLVTFTPTPTCGTATFTVNSARAKTMGKMTFLQVDINFTALGTCTNNLTFTTPNTPNTSANLAGKDQASTAGPVSCLVFGAGATAFCSGTANFTATSRVIASGWYENQ